MAKKRKSAYGKERANITRDVKRYEVDPNYKTPPKVRLIFMVLMLAVLMVCSWAALPGREIPITLQTFAIFMMLVCIQGINTLAVVATYIALGAMGLPVFAGLLGGTDVLTGPAGGYIVGFVAIVLVYWAFEKLFKAGIVAQIVSMIIGLAFCYLIGVLWYQYGYLDNPAPWKATLKLCVTPYILPDLVKLFIAIFLGSLIKDKQKLYF